jgi:flavodoxin
MAKPLVIFYSYTGTCRRLAQLMCDQQGWDMHEIVEARRGRGTWRCLLDSWLHRRPKIIYDGALPTVDSMVILVAPIWAYRLAGPMRSFVAAHQRQLGQFAVVSVMGGRGAPNAVAEIGRLTGRSPVLSTAFSAREVEDGSCAARLQGFAEALMTASAPQDAVRPGVWSPRTA